MDIKLQIYSMLDDSNVNSSFADLVLSRLDGLGFSPESHHVFTIGFAIIKTFVNLNCSCNLSAFPQELIPVLVDLSTADVLSSINACSHFQTYFDDDTPIKSVAIGDTSVSFDYSSCESVDNFINALICNSKEAIVCFRKLRW